MAIYVATTRAELVCTLQRTRSHEFKLTNTYIGTLVHAQIHLYK